MHVVELVQPDVGADSGSAKELHPKVISERAERAAIIVTTNLPFSEWTTVFPNPRLCKSSVGSDHESGPHHRDGDGIVPIPPHHGAEEEMRIWRRQAGPLGRRPRLTARADVQHGPEIAVYQRTLHGRSHSKALEYRTQAEAGGSGK